MHDSHVVEPARDEPAALAKSSALKSLWSRAFGLLAPGGASSTPSPTRGRNRGISAPGVAETAQRQGAPDQEAGTEGGPDPETLHATQRTILHPVRTDAPAADELPVQGVRPTIRRFTGDKRTMRVGPLRFTDEERVRLQEAAAEHNYKGESGFAADIVLAFITGQFTANLPLSEDRRRTHIFRAQVLRALNRTGSNVNQIARALNTGYTPPDITQRLDELHHLLTDIAQALCRPSDPREV